ncbi:hypothetical protein TNCV_2407151 [Trichonephila clavipes]|nr:hypothetical protein TNCV_2407151 [Trichonephila clavipes]
MEMDNRNEPTDMDLIDSPRRTPTPPPLSEIPRVAEQCDVNIKSINPPLSACEQILQNKTQLQKMESFKSSSWPASLNFAMPDHHPDEPFYRRAVSELQEVEETINLAAFRRLFLGVWTVKQSSIPYRESL